jgi:PAS domain S-box-containing protein
MSKDKNQVPESKLHNTDFNQDSVADKDKLYKSLFELSPVGIILEDSSGNILDVNDAISISSGYPSEEMIGMNVKKLAPPEHEKLVESNISRLLKGEVLFHEVENIRKDGSVSYMELREKKIILPDGKTGILVFANDVTTRRLAEESAKKYMQELETANATKDKFFSIIAHDLKSPFNAILGFSKLLFEDFNDFTEEEKLTIIENIKLSSESTYKLLQNLLEWAKMQTNQLIIRNEDIDVCILINDTIDLLKSQAEQKNIKIFSSVRFDTLIYADENIIKTVLRNLISNAIKFSYPGNKVKIFSEEIDGEIKISVQDFGIGLTEEEKEYIFKFDSKYKKSGTQNERGTGIGLMLCKEFIERNGGRIKFESTTEYGSTFSILVPKVKSD